MTYITHTKAHITDVTAFDQARAILLPLGEYFQVQDDFLDCYGSPEVIGKIGTDIEDNKCSWLINQALSKATPEQRQILEVSPPLLTRIYGMHFLISVDLKENYGRKDAEKVAQVKQVFKDLNIEQVYRDYEEASYARISGLIEKIDETTLPKKMFYDFMDR
jgi:farnesyl diphosphate synthase